MKKKLLVSLVILFSLAVVVNCGDLVEVDDDYDIICLYCDDTISWNSYGKAKLDKYKPDRRAWDLVDYCGWEVYQGHRGGVGDTLEVYNCGDGQTTGVRLVWAWNTFSRYYVYNGWTGATKKGIGIGASLDDYLTMYPNFYFDRGYNNIDFYEQDDPRVVAKFEDEKLVELWVYGD